MRNFLKQFAVLPVVLAIGLSACGSGETPTPVGPPGTPTPVDPPGTPPPASGKTITFIHYNDLHAHLVTHLDLVRKDGNAVPAMRGGLARIATVVKQIRADNPDSVLMNIGDTYHGGVEALYTNGNAIVAPMNALGIDIGVPGNWDWTYGPDVTRLRYKGEAQDGCPIVAGLAQAYGTPQIERPNFPNLGGNVTYKIPANRAGQPFLPPTATMDIGGVKVGFIGMTSDIVPVMAQQLAACLDFMTAEADYVDYVETHARALRDAGAKVVVVMSELGIHKDKRLADVIDAGLVNVFFSAHTHEATFEPINSASGALVVEAGNDGYVGRMDLDVATGGTVTGHHWELIPVTSAIPEDPDMLALVQAARAPFLKADPDLALPAQFGGHELHQSIATVIGQAPYLLSRRQALESTFNDAFSDMQRLVAGTDIALTPGFRFDAVDPAAGTLLEDNTAVSGDITLEDAYLFFPAPYTLARGEISGASLKGIIEDNLSAVFSIDVFKQAGGWFDGYSGIDIRLNLAAPDGQRVKELRRSGDGSLIADGDTLSATGCRRPSDFDTVTMCSYSAFSNVQALEDPETGAPWYVVDFFKYVLQQGLLPQQPRQSITDESGTPMWPDSEFVQPLEGV
jgi:2',3'-cyclic-nucleotide 2'-phosphodiesterase (5'-nucleotidase family)